MPTARLHDRHRAGARQSRGEHAFGMTRGTATLAFGTVFTTKLLLISNKMDPPNPAGGASPAGNRPTGRKARLPARPVEFKAESTYFFELFIIPFIPNIFTRF